MSTKRQLIQDYVVSILEDNVEDIKQAEWNRLTAIDVETAALPAAFVYGGKEQKILVGEEAPIGWETWRWPITIEVWAQDTDMETLLGNIHEQMHSGQTMGGKAVRSERMGVEHLVIDPEQRLQAMLIEYEIIYRHVRGGM